MITGVHESNGERWRNTTISHLQGLVKRDPTVLRRKKYGFFPLVRAISWGANLDTVKWMYEQYKEAVFWEDKDGWCLEQWCSRGKRKSALASKICKMNCALKAHSPFSTCGEVWCLPAPSERQHRGSGQ